jgi:hypothetical protein
LEPIPHSVGFLSVPQYVIGSREGEYGGDWEKEVICREKREMVNGVE